MYTFPGMKIITIIYALFLQVIVSNTAILQFVLNIVDNKIINFKCLQLLNNV